jgi:hypothetical protein
MAKKNQLLDLRTYKQSNRVAYASYDFTGMQSKVFAYIIYQLQEIINQQLKNNISVSQLSLFKEDKNVEIKIALKEFAGANNYKSVIESIRSMSNCWIKFPETRGADGMVYEREKVLISGLSFTNDKNTKIVVIEVDKVVAERIVDVKTGYTKLSCEIIMRAKNKYTPRIYQLICRWRDKSGFKIKYSELRDMLLLPEDKYKEWKDFKKRIIKDVQAELNPVDGILKSDVWFEVEMEKQENAQYLNFKILTPEIMTNLNNKRDYILELLRIHFGYTENDYKPISKLLITPDLYQDVLTKLIQLKEDMAGHKDISNAPAYVNTSLLNEFKGHLK